MKKCVMFGAVLSAFLAFGAGTDVDGNAITGKTLFGDVDGAETTLSDVLAVGEFATTDDLAKATPGDYANVSNKAYSAATAAALADETTRAKAAEAKNADAIAAETTRAKAAEASLASLSSLESLEKTVEGKANAADLAAVATSGKYADLTGTPTIPTVPTAVSAFKNDAGYVTESVTNGLAAKSDLSSLAPLSSLASHTNDTANPHKVTAAQVGVTLTGGTLTIGDSSVTPLTADTLAAAETDPTFAAWTNDTSIVAGNKSKAGGSYTVAFGSLNTAGRYQCSAFGYENTASGDSSSAFGCKNKAEGWCSSAFGFFNKAIGEYSTAMGYFSTANGQYSLAAGLYNTADGKYSSAAGYYNTASGNSSSAFGYGSKAFADDSAALGYMAYAAADSSLAFSQPPSLIYLNSSATNSGATARTLQSYLDERATTNALAALEKTVAAKADAAMISADNATFSSAVRVAAKALVKERLAALDRATSSIGETIAALQSIYADDTAAATSTEE